MSRESHMPSPECETCGRRPSERFNHLGGPNPSWCLDPIHDQADLGPEALVLLRWLVPEYEAATKGRVYTTAKAGEVAAAKDRARALLTHLDRAGGTP